MSEFKVGDLIKRVYHKHYTEEPLKIGNVYNIKNITSGGSLILDGYDNRWIPDIFELAERRLKTGDKVKVKGLSGTFPIFEIAQTMAILGEGHFFTVKLSDLEKVEEKKVPPNYMLLSVWNGEKPKYPKKVYSMGYLNGDKLVTCRFCEEGIYFEIEHYENWEVIE